jgi:hypothetical protein
MNTIYAIRRRKAIIPGREQATEAAAAMFLYGTRDCFHREKTVDATKFVIAVGTGIASWRPEPALQPRRIRARSEHAAQEGDRVDDETETHGNHGKEECLFIRYEAPCKLRVCTACGDALS